MRERYILPQEVFNRAWPLARKLMGTDSDTVGYRRDGNELELLLEFHLVNADGSPCKEELEQLPGYRELFSMIGQYRIEEPKNYGENGGIKCDVDEGPCACGAWH